MDIDYIGTRRIRDYDQVFRSTKGPTRRQWIGLGALAVLGACGRKKGSGYPGYALIATSGEESLGVVDLTAFRVLDPVPVRGRPTAVLRAGSSNSSYVLTPETGSVHILDGNLKVVRSQKVGDELSELRVSSNGLRLLAIAGKAGELIEADPKSLRVLRRNKLRGQPVSLDLAGPFAAVSMGNQGIVQLFDLETGGHWQAEVPGRIGAVRFRADGQRLLIANVGDPVLRAVTVPDLRTIADLPLAMTPQNLCFNADAGQLFVTGAGMDGIAIVFPYNLLEVEQTVLAGRDPGVMACSANPPFLFVGSNSGSDVCVLSIENRKLIGAVDVGQRPTYITVTPDSQYALVLDESAGAMAIIRIPVIRTDPAIVRSKSGASLFTMLAVGDKPVHAAVVPFV